MVFHNRANFHDFSNIFENVDPQVTEISKRPRSARVKGRVILDHIYYLFSWFSIIVPIFTILASFLNKLEGHGGHGGLQKAQVS